MKNSFGSITTMALVAVLLAGLGYWQFAGVGLGDGEHENEEGEHETAQDWRREPRASTPGIDTLKQQFVAKFGGRVLDIEQENDDGRALYEVKLVDADGRRRELLVDRRKGEVVRASD